MFKNQLPSCVTAVHRAGIFSLLRELTLQIQNKSLEKWCQHWVWAMPMRLWDWPLLRELCSCIFSDKDILDHKQQDLQLESWFFFFLFSLHVKRDFGSPNICLCSPCLYHLPLWLAQTFCFLIQQGKGLFVKFSSAQNLKHKIATVLFGSFCRANMLCLSQYVGSIIS